MRYGVCGSPVSIYRSNDAGASWTRQANPKLPDRGKAPFAMRVMRFARHPSRPDEIYAALEVGGVMRSTDGGESWSDSSDHLVRLSVDEPRLRSRIVSDTEAEGMLDGLMLRSSITAMSDRLFKAGLFAPYICSN